MRKMKWCLMASLILTGLMLGGCAWLFPPPLQAVLVADRTSGNAPLRVQFDPSRSTGPITSFTLNFGDGSLPYTGSPPLPPAIVHTYRTAGTYTATLTVQDNMGRTNTASVVITVTAPPAPPPTTLTLGAIPASGPAPLEVNFRVTLTAAPGRKVVRLTLRYGDGSPDYDRPVDLVTYDDVLTRHTYTRPGSYTATLTATDDLGQTTSASVAITVGSPRPQIVTFTVTPNPVARNTNVTFEFQARPGDPARRLVKWQIRSGEDGHYIVTVNVAPTDSLNVTHVYVGGYARAGTYTVTLRVWDDQGNVAERTVQITVT